MSGMLADKWGQILGMPHDQIPQEAKDELIGYGTAATAYQIALVTQKCLLVTDTTAPVVRMLLACLVDAVDGHMPDYRAAMKQARDTLSGRG